MRRLSVLTVSALLGLLATVFLSQPRGAALVAAAPSSSPLAVDEAVGALLWVRPREATPGGSERSLWLGADGRKLRSSPGIFLHDAPRTLRLVVEASTSPAAPCPRGHAPFPIRTLQRVSLEDEGGARTTVLPEAQDTPAEEFHRPLAGLGSWLFFRSERVEEPCAERPRYTASFRVFRVSSSGVEAVERPVDPVPERALAAYAAVLLEARLGPLRRVQPERIRSTMLLPVFSTEGAEWQAQLTAPVPWELSFGGWGSETASVWLSGARPLWFPGEVSVPAVALRFAREHPELEVAGVSPLPP